MGMQVKLMRFLRPLLSEREYEVRRGPAKGLKRKGGFEFIPESLVAPSEEDNFLKTLDLNGKTVFDVGGYQGRLTIFFARAVGEDGKVITYEPNPMNYSRIIENVRLNGFKNVDVRQLALGESAGSLELRYDDRDSGRSSLRNDYFEKRDHLKANKNSQVKVDTLDNQIIGQRAPVPDFVKMDVEEFEFEVLQGMCETIRKHKPQIFVEMHGSPERIQNVVNLMFSYGYSVRRVESGEMIGPANASNVKGGDHLYCF